MLLAHYLPKLITALFGGLFISLGFYTFGNALLFDRIFIGVLIFTGIVCRKNIDVLGVVAILIGLRILDESGWYIFEHADPTVAKVGFYLLAIASFFKLKFDPLSKLMLLCLVAALSAEIYWFATDATNKSIHWYMYALFLALVKRYFIFVRVSYTEDWFDGRGESINLDWHIYKLAGASAFIQAASVIEYFIRNVAGFKNVLVVYNLYPYAMQAIATYTVWIIFHESYKLLLPKIIRV